MYPEKTVPETGKISCKSSTAFSIKEPLPKFLERSIMASKPT